VGGKRFGRRLRGRELWLSHLESLFDSELGLHVVALGLILLLAAVFTFPIPTIAVVVLGVLIALHRRQRREVGA
jgi:hypothetical protein